MRLSKKNISNRSIKSIQSANFNFQRYFKIDSLRFMDPLVTIATNRYSLNIANFDSWLHTQGYTEEAHGSIRNYINLKYGKSAMKYIISLLVIRPKTIKRRTKRGGG